MNDCFEAEWRRCRPWLEAALEYDGGFYGIEDIRAEVEAGEAQFWPGERSAVVTQVWPFPKVRALHYWLAGGELSELRDTLQPTIEAWAAGQGCTRAIIAGRRGWLRTLNDF